MLPAPVVEAWGRDFGPPVVWFLASSLSFAEKELEERHLEAKAKKHFSEREMAISHGLEQLSG